MFARHRFSTATVSVALTVVLTAAACGGDGPSDPSGGAATSAAETFRQAAEAGDLALAVSVFADDIVLHSPALEGPDYRGPEVAAAIVGPAFQIFEDVKVTDILEAEGGDASGLLFDARVGDEPAQGFVLLRTRGEQVSELTLLLRPLPTLQSFVSRMGELGAQPAIDLEQQEE